MKISVRIPNCDIYLTNAMGSPELKSVPVALAINIGSVVELLERTRHLIDAGSTPRFAAETLATAPQAGATGLRVLRADSQFYNADVVAACRRADTCFSITTGSNPSIKRAIAAIDEDAWRQIRYPTGVLDPDTRELIYDAQVAA